MEGNDDMIFIAFFALAAAVQAPQGARQQAHVVMPENARQREFQEQYGYADAVVSNGIVYLSGVPVYLAPGETDMDKAFTRAFEALGKTLARAGVTFGDVVQVKSVHTDVNGQIEAMVKVKNRYMTGKPPAWTAVGSNGLLQPGEDVQIAIQSRHRLRRFEGAAAGEDGQPAEERPLVRLEQIVTPIDGVAQGALAPRRITRAARQQR